MPVTVEQASCLFLEDRRDACPTGGILGIRQARRLSYGGEFLGKSNVRLP
ncbi:MAG: hypothetical protein SXA11_00505 [Cyanobacteriota bacterium]|nr:hypothetical protein [Cyanobacteriota bacterium]